MGSCAHPMHKASSPFPVMDPYWRATKLEKASVTFYRTFYENKYSGQESFYHAIFLLPSNQTGQIYVINVVIVNLLSIFDDNRRNIH